MDIVLVSMELQKLLEIILCIDEGLDKVKLSQKIVHNTMDIEQYSSTMIFNFNINVSVILYDEFVHMELNETQIKINITSPKFYADTVKIEFSPLILNLYNKSNPAFVSNLFLKEFNIKLWGDHNSTNCKIYYNINLR